MEQTIIRKLIRQIKARRVWDNDIVRINLWVKDASKVPNTVEFDRGMKLDRVSCNTIFMSYRQLEYQIRLRKDVS